MEDLVATVVMLPMYVSLGWSIHLSMGSLGWMYPSLSIFPSICCGLFLGAGKVVVARWRHRRAMVQVSMVVMHVVVAGAWVGRAAVV